MARPQVSGSNPVRVRFVEFELDEANASLLRDGRPLALAPTPFAVLCAMARRPGSLLTKDALLDEVWGHRFVTESVLKTAIGKVRTALRDNARNPRLIETVPRRGYRFVATTRIAQGVRIQGQVTEVDAAEISPERALHQIGELIERCTGRKPLMLLIEHPHGIDRAAARLVDHIARWLPEVANGVAFPGD